MNHTDHVRLLRDAVAPGETWADLGSGGGAFTLALAELVGPSGHIYSVDQDASALCRQAEALGARFPDVPVTHLAADFTQPLALPSLDGVVMANSLHYLRDKEPVLRLVRRYLNQTGALILVEYDTDRGNPWVPHPLSFKTWQRLAPTAGFGDVQLLATAPSSFLGRFYSAVARR